MGSLSVFFMILRSVMSAGWGALAAKATRAWASGSDRLFHPGPDPAARYDAVAPAAETDAAVERGSEIAVATPNEATGPGLDDGAPSEAR